MIITLHVSPHKHVQSLHKTNAWIGKGLEVFLVQYYHQI
jgi:hypothetical protein